MAFIQKYIIYILLAVIVGLSIFGGTQYVRVLHKQNTIVSQKADIETLNVTVKDLNGQVSEYKAQVVKQKEVAVQQQAVENETARLREQINKIKSQCVLGVEDEKIIDDVTTYFNNGVQSRSGDSKTGGQVLPAASKADSVNPRWTIRQIVDNYIIVIDYSLKMEKTLNCYEGGK
jgi:cell division protein FtsB